MTFSQFNRRLHLYLGLALLPWFFMYGVSSIPIAHNQFFNQLDTARGLPAWTVRFERPFAAVPPDEPAALRDFGGKLLREAGIEGTAFGVARPNRNAIAATSRTFRGTVRVTYAVDQKKITVEDRRYRFDQYLTNMHARGGFAQDGVLQDSWAIIIDVVSVAVLVWIATGLYMWWGATRHRAWGWVAILCGAGSFLLFTLGL